MSLMQSVTWGNKTVLNKKDKGKTVRGTDSERERVAVLFLRTRGLLHHRTLKEQYI